MRVRTATRCENAGVPKDDATFAILRTTPRPIGQTLIGILHEAFSMPSSLLHTFRRERVQIHDRNVLVIKSTCKRCGESFVLDIRDGLDEAEKSHFMVCKGGNQVTHVNGGRDC